MTLIVPLTRRRTVDLMRLASATCRGRIAGAGPAPHFRSGRPMAFRWLN